jgi:hypothetical protein
MMRQVAGAFMEYEKGRLVAKLPSGRERKRKETGSDAGGSADQMITSAAPYRHSP